MERDVVELLKDTWPEWELVEKIGEGSFGKVYRAVKREMDIESEAAIKIAVIPADRSEIDSLMAEGHTGEDTMNYFKDVVREYETEIRLMQELSGNGCIVDIKDFSIKQYEGEPEWYLFIRMEYLTPLMTRAAAGGFSQDEVIEAGIDLCRALEVCSRRKIIHRDIKPENVLVSKDGVCKLSDFGVARTVEHTTSNISRKGTPNYMAPEVYRATVNEADFDSAARSDIYSLGMVLYWMANRMKLPFIPQNKQLASPADRKNAFNRRISGEALPRPVKADAALGNVILKACAYEPADRYRNATEFRRALENVKVPVAKNSTDAKDEAPVSVNVQKGPESATFPVQVTKSAGEVRHAVGRSAGKRRKRFIVSAALILAVILAGVILLLVLNGSSSGINAALSGSDNASGNGSGKDSQNVSADTASGNVPESTAPVHSEPSCWVCSEGHCSNGEACALCGQKREDADGEWKGCWVCKEGHLVNTPYCEMCGSSWNDTVSNGDGLKWICSECHVCTGDSCAECGEKLNAYWAETD